MVELLKIINYQNLKCRKHGCQNYKHMHCERQTTFKDFFLGLVYILNSFQVHAHLKVSRNKFLAVFRHFPLYMLTL